MRVLAGPGKARLGAVPCRTFMAALLSRYLSRRRLAATQGGEGDIRSHSDDSFRNGDAASGVVAFMPRAALNIHSTTKAPTGPASGELLQPFAFDV